jgi:glycosyltransferase involved in cell wall biosynthesis
LAPKSILFLGADADYMLRFRGALIRRFVEKHYRVIVAAPWLGGASGDFGAGVAYCDWPIAKTGLHPLADLRALARLWRLLRRERPDILFAHTIKPVIYGLTLAQLARTPRRTAMVPGLGYAFTEGAELRRRLAGLVGRLGYRLALGGADVVLFQNDDDRQTLRQIGALPAATPTALVSGSGVDMQWFAQQPFPPGPPTFLMVARLLRDKGVYEYVEAARLVKRQFPTARFVLVGASDSNPAAVPQQEVRQWVSEGLIEGDGHKDDPRQAYAACQVFVLPSYREGTPRANLEAMAVGRAVITTQAPGCRETVIDGITGLLVPPRDARALAEAMLSLARDPDRAKAMGEAGRRFCAERFEINAVARDTVALIEG